MGYLTAIGVAVIWGLVYAIRQKTFPVISPLGVLFINAIITLTFVVPMILHNRSHLSSIAAARWSDIAWVLLAGVLAFAGTWMLFTSIDKLGASMAAMIEISYPLFVVLFCYLLLGTTINWAVAFGGGLIFIGSWVILVYGKSG